MNIEEIEEIKQIARSLLGWHNYAVEVKGENSFNLSITGRGCETLYYGYFEYNKGTDPKMEMEAEYQGKLAAWEDLDKKERMMKREMEGWIATLASQYYRAGYENFKITVRITE